MDAWAIPKSIPELKRAPAAGRLHAALMLPTAISDLSSTCIASVKATLQIELDYSPEMLPLLDHYAKTVLDSPEEEIMQLTAPLCGAYFGETLRRALPKSRWHAPKGEHADWRLEFENVFLYFNPVGIALDVILEAEGPYESHLGTRDGDADVVKHALGLFGHARETDFYSFALNYEVIEQVVMSLARQSSGERFDAKAYETHRQARRRATMH